MSFLANLIDYNQLQVSHVCINIVKMLNMLC